MSTKYLELLEAHHRKSMRLPNHDYTRGTYFVTICAKNNECLFGKIVKEEMQLSEYGRIAEEEWLQTPTLRPEVTLDVFQIMPNHVHEILRIIPVSRGMARHAPTDGWGAINREFGKPIAHSLGTIIGAFKSAVSKRIRRLSEGYEGDIWQHNYHEHIIRNEAELEKIRIYIRKNPENWGRDGENMKRCRNRERDFLRGMFE